MVFTLVSVFSHPHVRQFNQTRRHRRRKARRPVRGASTYRLWHTPERISQIGLRKKQNKFESKKRPQKIQSLRSFFNKAMDRKISVLQYFSESLSLTAVVFFRKSISKGLIFQSFMKVRFAAPMRKFFSFFVIYHNIVDLRIVCIQHDAKLKFRCLCQFSRRKP